MRNDIDYDPEIFDVDKYGNLIKKNVEDINDNVLTGTVAEETVNKILDGGTNLQYEWDGPYVSGYFKEGPRWTAFDNTTKNCWVESFETKQEAVAYCNGDDSWDNQS